MMKSEGKKIYYCLGRATALMVAAAAVLCAVWIVYVPFLNEMMPKSWESFTLASLNFRAKAGVGILIILIGLVGYNSAAKEWSNKKNELLKDIGNFRLFCRSFKEPFQKEAPHY